MTIYCTELRTRKYVERYGFFSFVRKYRKILLDRRLDTLKTAFKQLVHRAAEATSVFLGNKITDKIVKVKQLIDDNPRNVEEIIILLQKR